MLLLGNILWPILGGILIIIIYYIVGLLMCITIIGIPCGVQLFKLGTYALWPFGHELVDGPTSRAAYPLFEPHLDSSGLVGDCRDSSCLRIAFCITIVGIPFGLQHFKMALSSIFPFGKEIR